MTFFRMSIEETMKSEVLKKFFFFLIIRPFFRYRLGRKPDRDANMGFNALLPSWIFASQSAVRFGENLVRSGSPLPSGFLPSRR